MKSLLFNLIYALLLLVATPWLIWRAFRYGKNRRGWGQKLLGAIPRRVDAQENQNCIWLHAVSVGEVNLLATLLGRLQKELPGWRFAISTSTETGYDLACSKYADHQVFFCPTDFSWAINRVLDRLNPSLVILAELEVWPNMTRMIKRRGIPLAIVNGRLSESSFRGYRRIIWLMRRLLGRIDLIASQSKTYTQRFRELGADDRALATVGNVKFDGAQADRNNALTKSLRNVAGIGEGEPVFVAGSTQPEEDQIAINVWRELVQEFPDLRLILVPRHPQNVGLAEACLRQGANSYSLRSQLNSSSAEPVIIVDVVGELGGWWGCADVAYVGGSMGSRGGQNMIEPSAYGIPVSFGPNTRNFKDVTELLLAAEAARVVANGDQLSQFVRRVLDESQWAAAMGARAQSVVAAQQGAADRTVELLLDLIEMCPTKSQRLDAA